MTDPADEEEGPAGEDSPPTPDGPPNRRRDRPIDPKALLPNLAAFQALQRDLFKLDLGALSSIQRMLDNSPAAQISKMLDAQTALTRQFAKTVDFSQLVRTPALDAALKSNIANAAWANSMHKSINLPQLNLAFTQTVAFLDAARLPSHLLDSITKQAQYFASISDQISAALSKFDFTDLLERLERWIPTNLRDVEDLDLVATVALEDGIPVAWVPRPEIVAAIVEAATSEERIAILESRRDDILDDCDHALAGVDGECATECRVAIGTLRAGFHGSAQSHAANIVDSIVLAFHGKYGRTTTRKRAQLDFDDLPLRVIAENLALRPLLRALVTWWPTWGAPPPEHFARHATAHAVGQEGVFTPLNALIAVMLATSLTVQYQPQSADDDPDESDTDDPDSE